MLKASNYFNDQFNILIISDDKIYAKMLQDYITNPNAQLKLKCNIVDNINKIDELQSKSSANLIIIQYFHFLTQNSDFQVLKFIYLDRLQYFNVSFQFILKFSFNFRILLINLKIFLNYFIIY